MAGAGAGAGISFVADLFHLFHNSLLHSNQRIIGTGSTRTGSMDALERCVYIGGDTTKYLKRGPYKAPLIEAARPIRPPFLPAFNYV